MSRWPPPLRFAIPGALFLGAIAILGLMVQAEVGHGRNRIENELRSRATMLGIVVGGEIEAHLREGSFEGARGHVEGLAVDPDLDLAILLDSRQTVRSATRVALEGRHLSEIDTEIELERLSATGRHETVRGGKLITIEPIRFPRPNAPFQQESGQLVMVHDLRGAQTGLVREALERVAPLGAVSLLLILLVGLYLDLTITRRARKLARAAASIDATGSETRIGLSGSDSLARVAEAIEEMSARIRAGREALAASERSYRLMFAGTPLPAWLEDRDTGRILDMNRAALETYGFSRSELHELTRDRLEPPAASVPWPGPTLADGVELARHRRGDGEEILVELRGENVGFDDRDARIVVATDVSRRVEQEQALRRRDAILSALASTTQELMRSSEIRTVVPGVLEAIGIATGADRAYLWRDSTVDGEARVCRVAEWTSIDGTSSDDEAPRELPYGETRFAFWREALAEGRAVRGPVHDRPEAERALLEANRIQSMIVVPVFVAGDWWGLLGFEDHRRSRAWLDSEFSALRTVADLVGTALARERVEAALRRSELRLREAQRLGNTGHLEWHLQDDRLELSEEAAVILGIDDSDGPLGFDDFVSMVHPADLPGYYVRRRALLEDDEPFQCVLRFERPDGQQRVLEKRAEVLRDDEGRPQQIFSAVRDVTEETESREDLALLHQQMDAVVRSLPGMLVQRVIHPDGELEFPLVVGRLLTRFSQLVENGRSRGLAFDRIHPEDRERVIRAFRGLENADVDLGDEPTVIEYRAIDDEGEQLWLRSIFDLRRTADGRIISNGIVLDVTRERRAEEALRRTQKMEALGQLTGGIAHDFNNLLTVILGNLDFLREHVGADTEGLELVDIAERAADRGAKLTRRLLEFARKRPTQATSVQLNDLIERLDGLLKSSLGSSIRRRYELESELWPVRVDPGGFEDALLNLALNARDAIGGSGNVTIATSNRRLGPDYVAHTLRVEPGDYVMLTVSDDGRGMAPETVERIFEPFFTTKDEGKGTGLGLSMVFGFVRRAAGDIEVRSQPGHGTTFRIFLPRAEDDEEPRSPSTQQLPGGRGELVLVVDDEPALAALAGQMLEGLGYRVETCSDPGEALSRIRDPEDLEDLRLLFTDVVMPEGMNGVELAHSAVEERPELVVLLTSGFVVASTLEQARPRWRDTLLTKPYDRRALAERVRLLLDAADDA